MASLPWFHNVVLIESLPSSAPPLVRPQNPSENGWSHQHDSPTGSNPISTPARANRSTTSKPLSPPRNPTSPANSSRIPTTSTSSHCIGDAKGEGPGEGGLLEHITRLFSIELGDGFCLSWAARLRHGVDGEDFSIDLSFLPSEKLHAYFVVDLKTAHKFEPGERGADEFLSFQRLMIRCIRPWMGSDAWGSFCAAPIARLIAEYALRHLQRPVGVAGYQVTLTGQLPKSLSAVCPASNKSNANSRGIRRTRPRQASQVALS